MTESDGTLRSVGSTATDPQATGLKLQATTGRRGGYRLLKELAQCEEALRRAGQQDGAGPRTAWLLDNYSFLRGQIREVKEALPRGYYRDLPRVAGGEPRVYRLVSEWLAEAGDELNLDQLAEFLCAFQERTQLSLAELWAVGPLLKLALLLGLREEGEAPVRRSISALRDLETASWKDFVESVSRVHAILCQDPAGVYPRMDFETRDAYRHGIEGLARANSQEEEEVAQKAVELAALAGSDDARRGHVGYYLAGPGLARLRKRRPLAVAAHELLYRFPNAFYLGAAAALTLGIAALVCRLMWPVPLWLPLLLAVPASQVALFVLNLAVTFLVPPRGLPRLDFSEGIPEDCRTFVAVPTLLLSRAGVERLLERLEIHYLANRDSNLFFALLTDFPDSPRPVGQRDQLAEFCAAGIRELNQRYGGGFYLFHRDRKWNAREGVWMGWERKRGKLVEFNRLLLGEAGGFSRKVGDLSVLPSIRYVITLDSDTQLPRDTARKLIATMAHPLNRPRIDPATRTVKEGYALMQPRVSVSIESAGRSRLARIYSGQTGFDPYTTAVSDVYQDLHAQASFTGKGIYDVRAFEAVAGSRFPENTLLSHDLIEGEHARTGLVTDLEVIDDYPSTYQAYSKRKHRWVRGDWQVARWLFPTVPGARGRENNPLPAVSRWKIADNLRRSLLEISLFLLLLAGWFLLPGTPYRWALVGLAFLAAPAWAELGWSLLRVPPRRFWPSWSREVAFRFIQGHLDALVNLVFLPHQAALMADAILRTLLRTTCTGKKLLEWESMAQVEESAGRRKSLVDRYLLALPLAGLPLVLVLPGRSFADVLAVIVIELWMVAPWVVEWLNGAPPPRREITAGDTQFLRETALRTWRYFDELSSAEHHWLIPDNVQEDPPKVAARLSPTNAGLLLGAQLAAHDFGYLTTEELATRLGRTLETLRGLERCRGHFFNWYDTATLAPLAPRYVSTVDSGNLAAALIAVKQGCLELLRQPALGPQLLDGLRDHALRLRAVAPPGVRGSSFTRALAGVLRQLDYRPTDLFGWESALTELRTLALRLREPVEWIGSRLPATVAAEVDTCYGALAACIETALGQLYALAPWLASDFEQEFRSHARHAALSGLFEKLERLVPLEKLPAHYAAIEAGIRSTATARPLEPLLGWLPAAAARAEALARTLAELAAAADRLALDMDFGFLFDGKRKLLRIGWDAAANTLDDSCYDLLASEARTAVFLAIAKGEIPREAWFRLGRKLTSYRGQRTLISWSGTLFEYLMPALFMRTYEHTLLGESVRTAVRIQRMYGRERGVPWGISEAACHERDSALNYQYRAFGIPEVSQKQAWTEDLVVAPYASMLALMVEPAEAVRNLREMAARGWTGRYGFYEAVDFSPARAPAHQRHALVRAFMVHHQGMGLLAIANTLLEAPNQRRFHADPRVQATEYLLSERVPLLPAIAPEETPLPVRTRVRANTAGKLQADGASAQA